MVAAKDLSGMKFGKLLVVDRNGSNKHGKTTWNCVCECGNKTVSVGGNLVSGGAKSCGCDQKDAASKFLKEARNIDLTGEKYSKLQVVALDSVRANGAKFWLCKCDCGGMTTVSTSNLRSGNVKSCGCILKDPINSSFWKHGLSRTKEYLRDKSKRQYQRESRVPLKALIKRIRGLIPKSLTFIGFSKNQKTEKMLGCDYDTFRRHIERQFVDEMSWCRFNEIHIDHIVPMATAKTEEDAIRLCHFTNLRPVWAKDNLSKGAKREFLI